MKTCVSCSRTAVFEARISAVKDWEPVCAICAVGLPTRAQLRDLTVRPRRRVSDPEKERARAREYYRRTADKRRQYQREYYQAHRGPIEQYWKAWYAKHREERIARQRDYYVRKKKEAADQVSPA